jgi:ectoine hydroxylase-related dioxygenase (phytanoyl-CoA dioxygenase family)
MDYPNNLQEMPDANADLGNSTALRARLAEDGYLLFRQVIDPQKLLKLRARLVAILADLEWIEGGDGILEAKAIGVPQREGEAGYFDALDRIVKLEELHSLAHDEALMQVMRQVLGDTAFPHPLSITRLVFPHNPEITTPPHQDYGNNQGTPNLTAAWIPLGDCSREMGSIAILKGSHKAGLLPLQYHLGAGNRRAALSDEVRKLPWLATDFKAGDILLFPALTVHSALENKDPSRMRLSVDFRYQLEGEQLTEGCLSPHFNRVSWDDIYKDWQSTQYQYYWRSKKYEVVDWNPNLLELPEEYLKDAIRAARQYEKERLKRHQEKRKQDPSLT